MRSKSIKFPVAYQAKLQELGIHSLMELLYFFPKKTAFVTPIELTDEHVEGYFYGEVVTIPTVSHYGRTKLLRFQMKVDEEIFLMSCFNQTYLKQHLAPGMRILVSAKRQKARQFSVNKLYYKDVDAVSLQVEYSLLKGMRQRTFSQYIQEALQVLDISNFLPEQIHEKYKLIARKAAFIAMHAPTAEQQLQQAVRYFKYEEAFLFQLVLLIRKRAYKKEIKKEQKKIEGKVVEEVKSYLPFTLTLAQERVLDEIMADFAGEHVMYRMVQGDVGSGKTVIAMLSAFIQVKLGYQVAVLAPTSILAEQHYAQFSTLFAAMDVRIVLLKSQMRKKVRTGVLEHIANGTAHIIVGTHAVLEPDVEFMKLGYAIIDEQQRFGVEQRKRLRKKGDAVDVLYMTATPIPRTLAISVFGDLDVSTIDLLPAGRKAINTTIKNK